MSYNKEKNIYYGHIYLITNKINNKQYIGQTRQKLKYRWNQHIRTINRDDKFYMILHRAMYKYGVENFDFKELELVYANNEEELYNKLNQKEIDYIAQYDTLKPNGYNMTTGGNNVSLACCKPVKAYNYKGELIECFDSIVDAANFLCNGVADNISLCCNGKRKHVKGIIWRWIDDNFDKYLLTKSDIINIRLKLGEITIDQYSFDGNLINKFSSLPEIKRYFKKNGKTIHTADIHKCCNGKIKYAYNYIWRYSFDKFGSYNTNLTLPRRKIIQYSLNLAMIAEYEDIYEATKIVLLDDDNFDTVKKGIYRVCNGSHKTYRGYIWKYKDGKIVQEDYKNGFHKNYIIINQYDKNGVFISSYNSIKEAHDKTNVNNISKYCKDHTKTAGGFKWYYADDIDQPDKTKIITIN